jgi:hypothetical protein
MEPILVTLLGIFQTINLSLLRLATMTLLPDRKASLDHVTNTSLIGIGSTVSRYPRRAQRVPTP